MVQQSSDFETIRLQTLARYNILDTPPEACFDDIVRQTAERLNAPMAAFTLIDEARCWFKSSVGLSVTEVRREISFCGQVAKINAPLVLEDTRTYPDYAQNPLVTGPPNVAFYAGVPIRVGDNLPIGSLCIMDTRPRQFPWSDFVLLQELATAVEAAMEDRLSVQ